MQLTHFLIAAFAASASAATFRGFSDTSCQTATGEYVTVTAKELEDIAVQRYPTETTIPQASLYFSASDKTICPSNSDDTYKWVKVAPWARTDGRGGGSIAVVYYKETDTYALCRRLAAAQANGYAGSCRW